VIKTIQQLLKQFNTMYTINITGFPFSDSNRLLLIIDENKVKLSASDFNLFVGSNRNNLLTICNTLLNNAGVTRASTSDSIFYTRFLTMLYDVCSIQAALKIIRDNRMSYAHESYSALMIYIETELKKNKYSTYIITGRVSKSGDSYNNITIDHSWYPGKRNNKPSYSEEPSNVEEKVVNIVELATLLATSRLKEQGLVVEKEKEKFNRILNEYTSLIDKCVSTKNDEVADKNVENKEQEPSTSDGIISSDIYQQYTGRPMRTFTYENLRNVFPVPNPPEND